jgi:hypothetical protein
VGEEARREWRGVKEREEGMTGGELDQWQIQGNAGVHPTVLKIV